MHLPPSDHCYLRSATYGPGIKGSLNLSGSLLLWLHLFDIYLVATNQQQVFLHITMALNLVLLSSESSANTYQHGRE